MAEKNMTYKRSDLLRTASIVVAGAMAIGNAGC